MTLCKGKLLFQWMLSATRSGNLPTITQARSKWYSADYIEPTINKQALQQPIKRNDPRLYRPIMAPRTEQSVTFCYDPVVEKFINLVMKKGNKNLARKLVEETFGHIKRIQIKKYHEASEEKRDGIEINPVNVFHKAVENCRPVVQISRVRRGGTWFEVPVECKPERQHFKAMKFLIDTANDKERTVHFPEVLSRELIAAMENVGKSILKKQELLKRCEANKAFASYKWR